jgi:NDP-sugar pyrophosphorylase family protein
MKALILAAGLGTRLKPLTNFIAKPALPIAGVPTIFYSLYHLAHTTNIKDVYINLHFLSDSIVEVVEQYKDIFCSNLTIHYSDETAKILGSSGALWNIKKNLHGEDLIVMNADTISFPNLNALVNLTKKLNSKMSLVTKINETNNAYTEVLGDSSGFVTGLGNLKLKSRFFTGVYFIKNEVIETIPEGYSNLVDTVIKPLIQKKEITYIDDQGFWFDTGDVENFVRSQFLVLNSANAREIIFKVMKNITDDETILVPKKWSRLDKIQLKNHTILCGDENAWLNLSKNFGPNFIGIMPPLNAQNLSFNNAIQLGDFSLKVAKEFFS